MLAGAFICALGAASIVLPLSGPPGAQALSTVIGDEASSPSITSVNNFIDRVTEAPAGAESETGETPDASDSEGAGETSPEELPADSELDDSQPPSDNEDPGTTAQEESAEPDAAAAEISPIWSPVNPPKRIDLTKSTTGIAMSWGLARYGALGVGMLPMSSTWWNMPDVLQVAHSGSEFVALDGGNNFALGLTKSGDLYSWGGSSNGELGRGTNSASDTPGRISIGGGADPVVDFTAGRRHAGAVTASGKVYTWGYGGGGELGNGSKSGSNSPVNITANFGSLGSGVKIVKISAEQNHTMAIASDGSAYVWGLKFGTVDARTTPVKLTSNTIKMVDVQVGTEDSGLYAISDTGKVYLLTSDTQFTELGGFGGEKITSISAGLLKAMAVGENGSVFLIQNRSVSKVNLPNDALGNKELGYEVAVNGGQPGEHLLILARSGNLYGYGSNQSGQLGWGTADFALSPVITPTSASSPTLIPKTGKVRTIGAGGGFSLAVGGLPNVVVPPDPVEKGSITGTLWHDVNLNGVMDSGEPRLAGIQVRLFRGDRSGSAGSALQTVWTDGSGNYRFDGLDPANNYIVKFEPGTLSQFPYGWNYTTQATPCPQTNRSCAIPIRAGTTADGGATPKLTLVSGQNLTHVNAGIIPTGIRLEKGVINSATTLADLDRVVHSTTATVGTPLTVTAAFGNVGSESLGSIVLTDSTVRGPAVKWETCNGSTVVPQTVSPGVTKFSVSGVLLQNRVLSCTGTLNFTAPSQTHLDQLEISATGTSTGEIYKDQSQFEVTSVTSPIKKGSITGTVWHDANLNGVMEAGEPRIPFERVLLFRGDRSGATASALQTTWTDANGNYRFDGLDPANNYIVRFEPGVLSQFIYGWNFTLQANPCPQTNLSCATPFVTGSGNDSGATPKLTLAAGQDLTHVNAGLFPAGVRLEKGIIDSATTTADLDRVVHSTIATVGTQLEVTAAFGNVGSELLRDFVLTDTTVRGPAVEWQSCNGSPVVPQTLAPGITRYTLGATLLPNRVLSCKGTLSFTDPSQTHLDNLEVSATGLTSGETYKDTSHFEVTSVSGSTKKTIYIEKLVTGPTGSPVRIDGSSWALHTDVLGSPGVPVAPIPVGIGTGLFVTSVAPGPYWITETKAPSGYQALPERIRIMVGWDGMVTIIGGGSSAITATEAGQSGIRSTVSVRDNTGAKLPNAGTGSTLWIPLGGAAVLTVSLVLVIRRFRAVPLPATTGNSSSA